MVDAYLEWRHSLALTQTSPPPSMQSQEADFGDNPSAQLLSAPGHAASLGASNQETMPPPPSLDYTVEVFDLRTLHTSVTIPRLSDMSSTAKALVLAGYLGTTPVMPTLANLPGYSRVTPGYPDVQSIIQCRVVHQVVMLLLQGVWVPVLPLTSFT